MKKLLKVIVPLLLAAVFGVGVAVYAREFIKWENMALLYGSSALILLPFAGICAFTGKSKKGVIGKFFGGLAGGAVILFGLAMLINNVIFGATENELSISIVLSVFVVIVAAILTGYYIKSKKTLKKALCIVLAIVTALSGVAGVGFIWSERVINSALSNIVVATPNIKGVGKLPEYESVKSADFYVSPNGDDKNDGSLEKPFATIEKARDAVRALDKSGKTEVVVGIMAGEYRTTGITFTAEDSGTKDCPIRYCKYGEGEVVINGGVSLNAEDFTAVTDEAMLSRLNDEAKKNVVCVDLSKYNISAEDYGKLYAIGTSNSASLYDGDWVGPIWSEVFFNDVRMNLARYPDSNAEEEYLYTGEVVSNGENRETIGSVYDSGTIRNPKPDVFKINQELADRINSWEAFDDIWIMGWWKYDWSDASSPFGVLNYEESTLSPKFGSSYGTKEEAPYYFYNVFEELTTPGEFYLDRENAVLYIYPTADMSTAEIDMSLTTNTLVTLDSANYISFEGITYKGTRGDAISVNGNGNRIAYSLIKNIAGGAVISNGYDNLFEYNEITRTGKGGISLNGGDTKTLTAGNNRAENNLIHDWSEIYKTYQSAVSVGGVGNICAHNEIYNSPHQAISWGGNNNIIEYNIVHDVGLLTNDGGAMYSGRTWTAYGNVLRYNYIYDLGSTVKNGDKEVTYTPDGIYFDDNMAGQTAYGNILVNVPKNGFLVGSGRDNTVKNNIIINSESGITYDNRAREGSLNDGWFTHHFEGVENGLLSDLLASPWQSEAWQEAFPQYKNMTVDYSDIDNPNLPFNPAGAVVSENIIVSKGTKSIGDIADDVYRFSGDSIKNNLVLSKLEMNKVFTDAENGDYSINDIEALQKQVPGFEQIPIAEIGIKMP